MNGLANMRCTAHAKLTAVGRLAIKAFAASFNALSEFSANKLSAIPYAAETPINGAPRTCMVLIA